MKGGGNNFEDNYKERESQRHSGGKMEKCS
jgi:hypothetical protein